MKVISIIIPVYNEERYVWELLPKVASLDLSHLWYEKEIIIVNDGSKDNSATIIDTFMHSYHWICKYIYQSNSWKWAAIKNWITNATGDVYIIQDADLEYDPQDILILLEHMEKKHLDICYGSRTLGYFRYGAKYSTLFFFVGGLTISFLTTILSGKLVTDEPTCYKMYTKKCKDILLAPRENDFAWEPAVTMLLLKKRYSYAEKAIHYYPRKQQQWKKIKLIDWWRAIKTLFIYRFWR